MEPIGCHPVLLLHGRRIRERLDAPVVGAPGFDAFLDFLAGEVLFEDLADEFGDFLVGGEAEGDELVFSELMDAVPEGFVEKHGEAEALFKTDDAVLQFEGVGAELEGEQEEEDGEDEGPEAVEDEVGVALEAAHEDDDGEDEEEEEEGKGDEVVGGVELCVVFEVLGGLFAHGGSRFLAWVSCAAAGFRKQRRSADWMTRGDCPMPGWVLSKRSRRRRGSLCPGASVVEMGGDGRRVRARVVFPRAD